MQARCSKPVNVPMSIVDMLAAENARGKFTEYSPISWGRHKGTPYRDIPKGWLRWALEKSSCVTPAERRIMEELIGAVVPGPDGPVSILPEQKIAKTRIAQLEEELAVAKSEWLRWQKLFHDLQDAAAATVDVQQAIREAYWELARQYHPDHGGNEHDQAVLDLIFEELRKRLPGSLVEISGW